MEKIIATVAYRENEIHPEWESLFSTTVIELSKNYKISIPYDVKINHEKEKVELRLFDFSLLAWYRNTELRKKIIHKLERYLAIFTIENESLVVL